MRTALILGIVLQQIVLPVAIAQSGACGTAEVPAAPAAPAASCCSMAQPSSASTDDSDLAGCGCAPAFCACGYGESQPTPVTPERTNRTIDHLPPMLLASVAAVSLPLRAAERVVPFERTVHPAGHTHRIQAVLCIWRT